MKTLADDIRELDARVSELERVLEVSRARGVRKIELALANAGVITSEEAWLTEFVRERFSRYNLPYQEQFIASRESRIDFVVYVHPEAPTGRSDPWEPVRPLRVAVELKVKGTNAQVIRQLDRYAELSDIGALVLVTTKRRMSSIPKELRGKVVRVVCVGAL